jgi:hypothetical protein
MSALWTVLNNKMKLDRCCVGSDRLLTKCQLTHIQILNDTLIMGNAKMTIMRMEQSKLLAHFLKYLQHSYLLNFNGKWDIVLSFITWKPIRYGSTSA